MSAQRILVVGGVAGGASFAARARRQSENAEIILFERGPHVSFANCGLPYYVGEVITDEANLLMATPQRFRDLFRIDVRTRHEVTAIDREAREIEVVDLESGRRFRERYDELLLAPGAAPVRPPFPGIDLPGIFTLRTIPDSRKIREWIDERGARRAVVVGAGFIGLEMAENLARRGLEVTLIELQPQVLPPLDAEMAWYVQHELQHHGVRVVLGDGVGGFAERNGELEIVTAAGHTLRTDMVILGIGVKPEATLAREAGLAIGARGGIVVDRQMRTSDPHIFAVGDAVESVDVVTGQSFPVPLAGPANRPGRRAADIVTGKGGAFRGTQGTAVCGVFDMTAALTGANEKTLVQAGIPFAKTWLHPRDHAKYYPGAETMHMKVLYDPASGKLLGAQAVGKAGVERRIDVIATALQLGGTVYDLEEAELCYAPQYGSAKDAVNFAGMISANTLRGEGPVAHWDELTPDAVLIDVRDEDEFSLGHVPGARNIPLASLRERAHELPADRPVYVYCQVGQRGYYAARMLELNGIHSRNLSGGYETRQALAASGRLPEPVA